MLIFVISLNVSAINNIDNIMPMVYISREAARLLQELINHLGKKAETSIRLVKSDIIYEALKDYAERLGMEKK